MPVDDLDGRVLPPGQPGSPHAADPGSPPELGSYFVATYPPFSQWTAEAVADYLEALDRPLVGGEAPPLGLYVHVPFCVDRCRYCYYLSHGLSDGLSHGPSARLPDGRSRSSSPAGGRSGALDRYVDYLIAELALYADRPAIAGRPLDFVYFGGGTPSLLARSALTRLFAGLKAALPWEEAREVTFECAPKSVTRAKMELLHAAGVTRLSLGVQQLDDEVLVRNGRVHLTADVEAAWGAIRAAGFPVVNLDLMVGLVGETVSSLRRGVERVIELAPDSVTVYQMEIPLNTPLYRDLAAGRQAREDLADWPEKHRRVELAFDLLAGAGYRPISAYTVVKDPSAHGFVYQREQYRGADLLGIGASSFGYLQGVHQQNAASLGRYSDRVAAGRLPLGRAYRLDAGERLVRELVLSLKLGEVRRDELSERHGVDILERFRHPLEGHAEAGWLVLDDEGVRLTAAGRARVDRLIPSFYPARHRDVRYS